MRKRHDCRAPLPRRLSQSDATSPLRSANRLFLVGLAPLFLASILSALPQASRSSKNDTSTEASAGWPSWRGPTGTGSSPTGSPPTEWSEKKNIKWKVPIEGLGISSPIVWKDRIYLTTAITTDRKGKIDENLEAQSRLAAARPTVVFEFIVLALRRTDGHVIWRRKVSEAVPHEGGHSTNSFASASPVTDGKHIWANFGSRGLFCLDWAGNVVWSKQLGVMRTRRQYGEASSPALFGERLVVNWDHEGDSFIVVFDKLTGKEVWRRSRNEVTSWSTPIVISVGGRPQVVINATTASRGYDLETGDVIWSLSGMTVNCIPIPIHHEGVAYLMSGYRGNMLQAVALAGAKGKLDDGDRVLWNHRRSTSYVPSGLLHDGRLYFLRKNTAVLSCVDAMTGDVHYEGKRLIGLRTIYASPVCADGHIYITSRAGITMVIDHGAEFAEGTVNVLDEAVDASLAIVGDEIYLRGHEHLYCIAETGTATGDEEKKEEEAKEKRETPASHYKRTGSLGLSEERTASLSVGDLDSDGDLDLVVANGRHWPGQNKIFLNDGKGQFDGERKLGVDQSTTYRAALADMDGDGDLDAVVGNDKAPSHVYWNNGKGQFAKGPQVGKISNTRSVTLADLDGKHGIDVILTNRGEANLICFNDGEGGFDRQQNFGHEKDSTITVAVADLDGDGDLDLAVANRNGQQNLIYLNDGEGGFAESRPYGTGSDATRGVALADVDGDGHIDILNANIAEPNAIYFGTGKGRFDRVIKFGGNARSYALAVGDLNRDGRIDIVVGNAKAQNAIYIQQADGSFVGSPFGAPEGRTYGVVVADWNGDGRPEIATANSDGQNHLYEWNALGR